MLVFTSEFQTRKISYPSPRRSFVLSASAAAVPSSPCCDPSNSTINFASSQTKSAMKGPQGCCLRNFKPSNRRSRNLAQSFLSTSVCRSRSSRANFVNRSVTFLLPEREKVAEGRMRDSPDNRSSFPYRVPHLSRHRAAVLRTDVTSSPVPGEDNDVQFVPEGMGGASRSRS